jgi:chromosome segregation ATPase
MLIERWVMARARIVSAVGIVCAAGVIAGSMSAQTRTPQSTPPGSKAPGQTTPSALDDLLTEVRGLRADVNQAAGASIRAQLLVARLQLQEQRIGTAARQLMDVQNQLAAATGERVDMESRDARVTEELLGQSLSPDQRREIEAMLADDKRRLAPLQQRERQLQAQTAEMQALVATEQGRWIDFSDHLDTLERSLPTSSR